MKATVALLIMFLAGCQSVIRLHESLSGHPDRPRADISHHADGELTDADRIWMNSYLGNYRVR